MYIAGKYIYLIYKGYPPEIVKLNAQTNLNLFYANNYV
jgi:hypothetical protein